MAAAKALFPKHFPDFADAEYVCESWMLSPALREIMPETSRVRRFSERFSVVFWEEDSPAFRDWIFPTAVTASGKGADSAAGPPNLGAPARLD